MRGSRKLTLTPELADFVGKPEMTSRELSTAIMKYASNHGLKYHGKVFCNERLKKALGGVSVFEIDKTVDLLSIVPFGRHHHHESPRVSRRDQASRERSNSSHSDDEDELTSSLLGYPMGKSTRNKTSVQTRLSHIKRANHIVGKVFHFQTTFRAFFR